MKKAKRNLVFLFVIVLFAGIFRFWGIGTNPPSLTWDEVAWGYNAYAIGIDGKDEFGRFLPHDYLESFGDFKPPVYAYLAVLPIKFFGLNEFAVRFPSAFFGVLTVLITYFLVKRIFYIFSHSELYALLSAALLAFSPWHIMLSRGAWEANLVTFFLVTGTWLFLAGMQEKKWYLLLSAIFFALAPYTFNTGRIVMPLLILGLAVGFWRQLWQRKKQTLLALMLGIAILLPSVPHLLSPQARLRFAEVNFLTDTSIIDRTNVEVANEGHSLWSRYLHHRFLTYGTEFLRHYFDNLNFNFLFLKGDDNPKFSVQDTGQLYLWSLPFFIIGFLLIFRLRKKHWWIIPYWMFVGIIPAATARETPHALRIEATLPTFYILIAIGVTTCVMWVKSIKRTKLLQYTLLSVIAILFVGNALYFFHSYIFHYPKKYSGVWQYGYKDAITYAKSIDGQYDEVDMIDALGRPYIYYLFYTQTSPDTFRKEATITKDGFGFVHVAKIGKYKFLGSMDYTSNTKKHVLYINVPKEVPKEAHILRTSNYLNGEPSLVVYTM